MKLEMLSRAWNSLSKSLQAKEQARKEARRMKIAQSFEF